MVDQNQIGELESSGDVLLNMRIFFWELMGSRHTRMLIRHGGNASAYANVVNDGHFIV